MENGFTSSLWGDEAFSAILSMKSLPEIIKIIFHDTSPPLWNICEWIVFNTLGTEEIYIRGLAFAFFLGAVFFTYKIGAHLFSRKTGVLAALLTFFNPFFFTYAFEGRMYSIMAFGVCASMYFFLKRAFWPYIITTLWALYSHHFAFFAVFVQGVWFLYELFFAERKLAKKRFLAFVYVAIGYLPWIYPLYQQTKMVGSGFWLGKPSLKDLSGLIVEYLAAGIRDNKLTIPIFDKPIYLIAPYLVGLTLITKKWLATKSKTVFLIFWFLAPIGMTWLISQYFQSIFFNRYLLYTIPAAMLILASNRRLMSSILIAMTIVFFAIIDYNYFTHPTKLPFRQLAAYVKETQRQGDFLINWYSNGTHHVWETKYYGIPAPIYVPPKAGDLPFFVGTALMQKDDIVREIPPQAQRVGVVTSGSIDEVTLSGYTEKEAVAFERLKFIWYQRQ